MHSGQWGFSCKCARGPEVVGEHASKRKRSRSGSAAAARIKRDNERRTAAAGCRAACSNAIKTCSGKITRLLGCLASAVGVAATLAATHKPEKRPQTGLKATYEAYEVINNTEELTCCTKLGGGAGFAACVACAALGAPRACRGIDGPYQHIMDTLRPANWLLGRSWRKRLTCEGCCIRWNPFLIWCHVLKRWPGGSGAGTWFRQEQGPSDDAQQHGTPSTMDAQGAHMRTAQQASPIKPAKSSFN